MFTRTFVFICVYKYTTLPRYTRCAQPNDFVVLHGVTGAWSVLQLVSLLEGSPRVQRKLLGYFWQGLFLVLMAHGNLAYGPTTVPYRNLDDPTAGLASDNPVAEWGVIIKAVLSDPTSDEHLFKLVHVLFDLATSRSTASRFQRHDVLFRRACLVLLSHPIAYGLAPWPAPSAGMAAAL